MVHAVAYFHENYRKQISIEEYAAARGMSISWFIRSFKRYTGHTPNQYILSIRISNAQILLETTAYSVQEIASVVGYDNPLYFSRLFHKLCGQSPREFRDQFKEEEKDVEGRKEKDGIEFGE
jgi:AraC-like DNA-binding protein